jgi:dihydrofolate synthase/folylpolyglutamate synthase
LDYPAAVAALQSRGRFGISLGLERITALLDRLDHPERGLHGALVAGTNGKGSVVALARSVLNAAGLRVGSMPKPHLTSYRERIAIDGEPIGPVEFASAIARILPVADGVAATLGPPTEFEVLTAAAVAELAVADLDLLLIEVGMGGRLDATNALDLGVAAITNVQHDHERYLGSTLAQIGREKAAIIKPGDLAVTGATGRGLRPILDRCADVAIPLRRSGPGQPYHATLRAAGWDGILVDLSTPTRELSELRIGLLGGHQAANAAVALALLDALAEDAVRRGHRLAIDETAVRRGLQAARWPGRLEVIHGGREIGRVLLDGAHNPAGAAALAAALRELGVRGMPMVFGAMRGKRVSDMLRALASVDPRPVFATVLDPKAIPAVDLQRTWRRVGAPDGSPGAGLVARNPAHALRLAAELRRGDEPIVVAGSLYLVGAIRSILTGEGSES